ncbi:MAG: hypothetical protein IJ343_04180, partial [Clostridia bacterium]|nr:hypothetical protein [Clostridia bacterium]
MAAVGCGKSPAGKKRLVRLVLLSLVLAVAAMIFLFSAQNGPASSATSNTISLFIIMIIDTDFEMLSTVDHRSFSALV